MIGTIGWLCPKCNSVYAPSETMCQSCRPAQITLGFGTVVSKPVTTTYTFEGGFGTIFMGARQTTPAYDTPARDWKEERAEEIIKQWKGGKWSTLQELIVEALEEAEDAED